jgi:hypothetical protein
MHQYLQSRLMKVLNPVPFDPHIQRSIEILNLLVGEEETASVKAGLRSYVDELATSDSSPPAVGIFGT